MKTKSLSLKVSPSIGAVSAECLVPQKSKCIMTLAHGAGAGMYHFFMVTLSQSLSEAGISTMRFNFPFTENKKGRPDTPAVAHQTIEAAIKKAQDLFPDLPLFASGNWFVARRSWHSLEPLPDAAVKGMFCTGFLR